MKLKHFLNMPYVEAGQKVGLYGGSFNPPHRGHKYLAEWALKRFQLDQIWWMVTPGNPLKETDTLQPLDERIALSQAIVHNPRIHITAFEAGFRTGYSAQTVALVRQYRPQIHFVWLMGADNLANFHLWQNWRNLASMVSLGVVDRPSASLTALASPAARALSRFRVNESHAGRLALMPPPAWCFIHGPRLNVSSTALRASTTF